ncbi:Protein-cysteine N-palmitoyltransferase HHAT-like protein [Varanus komodoensis]|nr:Protein-cysteine N-palmitoyltransferase HHAT-like protein [Varanus komodoensis]
MGIKAALPVYELGMYALVVSCAIAYSGMEIFETSRDSMNRKAFRGNIRPGWHYFGRKMDAADFEWAMWFTSFRNFIIFALSGHVLFAKICSMTVPRHRSEVYMVYGILAVLGTMGGSYVMIILSHCLLLYTVALARQKWLCLVAGLCSLASFKLEPFSTWQNGFVTGTFDLQDVLFYGGSGFTIMRCMSFALENCERREGNYSIFALLKYNFYLPFFFFGPVMTFDRFHEQVHVSELRRKDDEMWSIRVHAAVHLLAIVVVDVFFHFFYILTIPSDLKFVSRLSDWALAGLAYSNLVYDWVKAAVMFGVINTISRLDHLDPPQPPKCITMLYVFAETHFDRGINDWLCKYVYNYIGENHDNILRELAATVATFAITTLWLGPCEIVYIWSVCNCFGLNFELWVQKFFQLEFFAAKELCGAHPPGIPDCNSYQPQLAKDGGSCSPKQHGSTRLSKVRAASPPSLLRASSRLSFLRQANMSEAMSRRIRAFFGAANFWAIVLYNVLALNSLDFALLVTQRILWTGFPISTLSIWFITYCGVQLIKERERILAIREEEKAEKEKVA